MEKNQKKYVYVYICVCLPSHHPTLFNPMNHRSPPGSSVHGIVQTRILEQVAMPSSRGSSEPRSQTHISYVSCTGRRFLHHWCHLGSPDIHKHPWNTVTQLYSNLKKTYGLVNTLLVALPGLRKGPETESTRQREVECPNKEMTATEFPGNWQGQTRFPWGQNTSKSRTRAAQDTERACPVVMETLGMLPKGARVCELCLLAAQKPINSPGWWEGKLALFQMPATGGGRAADICP